ncbi:hypothetical protein R3O61_019250 [Bacteroides hominis]|uniref:hypothetical protein n=1 Tax=Bacteroides hominis TaxID=2763023 RepID=UPI0029490849|nr:hypothetical protein [Bacteroides hominis (ex Liu et al. 2022)]MDV6134243.1 hypothetical protein [Bacteroides hominis (ex Liu et al. 2022)]
MRIHDSETNKCKKKLMLEPKEFEQGIEYALANDCDGLQVDTWNIVDTIMDFRLFEKVANQIVFLSFMNVTMTKLLQKSEMRKEIVIELSYKGFSRASDYS